MLANRTSLAQFLAEERRRDPVASEDLDALVLEVAQACATIARRVALGALGGRLGSAGRTNVHDEVQQHLDVIANDCFLDATGSGGLVAGIVSEELEEPHVLPAGVPRGDYLLLVDPLDGSSNIDVNVTIGSIFSIVRASGCGGDPAVSDYLQQGTAQVCAGYAMYGPATTLVLTLGRGVHAFTFDPALGQFFLTREKIRIPAPAREFAINVSNRRFWEPAVRRYVDECLAGRTGPRHRDFNMRWIASLVAETHRILLRGGVFLYPRDSKDPAKAGRLRLLYEANPVAFLIEQAGGSASTGRTRVLDVVPENVHQRAPLIFGDADEVARIEQYHLQHNDGPYDSPFYGERGLFRVMSG